MRADARRTEGQCQVENQIPLLCVEVGTDRVRMVLGARVDGASLPLPVPLSPLPSASWRGSRHLSHSSFPPCSFLFSLFPPPPPALNTMDSCLSLTVQGPGARAHPGPLARSRRLGLPPGAEHRFTALVYSEQQVLGRAGRGSTRE